MAKKYNGTINFASALRPTGAQPLDDRMVVQSMTDLMSFATFEAEGASAAYNGMMVAVLEEQKVFMLVNAAQLNTEDAWVSVGSGNGSLSVDTLAEAKALATMDNRGQIIFVINENATYVVTGVETVMKLAVSTAENIDEVVAALQSRVKVVEDAIGTKAVEGAEGEEGKEATGLYKEIDDLKDAVEAIEIPEVPVQDVTFNGESVLGENGVAAITVDLTPYETVANVNVVRENVAANAKAIEDLDAAVKAIEIPEVPVQDVTFNGESVLGENGVAAITVDLTPYAKTADVNAELAKKVDIVEGERLMTDAEGSKLAGIAEGAQVNLIEVVKVNGQALTIAAADKSVDVIVPTAPVQGVADDEKILSLDGDKLKTTLTLAYVPATETEKAVLRLQGKDGKVVSSIDATAFVKDGMLADAKLDAPKGDETGEKYLSLTFHVGEGTEEIRMDVSDLIDYYAAGDGLTLNGKTFSVQVDETANNYLQVTTNGIAVSQAFLDKITELDNAVLASAATDAQTKADAAQAAAIAAAATDAQTKADAAQAAAIAAAATDAQTKADAAQAAAIAAAATDATTKADAAQAAAEQKATEYNTAMNARVEALEAIDHDHSNKTVLDGIDADKVAAWDAAEQNAKDYADGKFVTKEGFNEFETAYEEKLNGIAAGAQVNVVEAVKVNGVDATVADKVAEVTIKGTDVAVGAEIKGDVKDAEGNILSKQTIYQPTATLAEVLQGIQDSVSVAVSGGLKGVNAGIGVEVSEVAANAQTVSVKVSAVEGNMITADENGIYAAMYYEGDDAE